MTRRSLTPHGASKKLTFHLFWNRDEAVDRHESFPEVGKERALPGVTKCVKGIMFFFSVLTMGIGLDYMQKGQLIRPEKLDIEFNLAQIIEGLRQKQSVF